MNLTFYIDNEKGVQIEDCEKVSKAIDSLLDELNPTDDSPYILSVSSPGLDRPLKSDRDLKRNIDKEISITLFAKLDGQKKFDGKLIGFDEKTITIRVQDKDLTIEREKIAHIVPIIKF